jgi:hypothetical protein
MFELHITVNTNNVEQFKSDCKTINCKPIVIEVQNNNYLSQQVMTSSKYNHFDYEVEILSIKNKLMSLGYEIKRIKVEVPPDFIHLFHLDVKYYESHLRVSTPRHQLAVLKEKAKEYSWHPSRNIFKYMDNDMVYQMLTYRSIPHDPDSKYSFYHQINNFPKELKAMGFNYDKIEIEACILDTNEELDKQWLELTEA